MCLCEHKKKRLHEGGVGPEMRSPAGLTLRIIGVYTSYVKDSGAPRGIRGQI